MKAFEDIEIGDRLELGSLTFTPEAIVAFARLYDPQRFHLSDEEAAKTHFGRLAASGWHTAAGWMRCWVTWSKAEAERAAREGRRLARTGPSPGFDNLVWKKPVFAGDTVRYTSTVTAKRESASRPEWGLVSHRNEGFNQAGELVFGFDGIVFVARRGELTRD